MGKSPDKRVRLEEKRQALAQAFRKTGDADAYLAGHADVIDALLAALYKASPGEAKGVALVATGGYGRRELYPHSDIDLLFLYDSGHEKEAARVAEFVLYSLWDMGLKIGQAHRSIEDTVALAKKDITIRTGLIDARPVAGKKAVFGRFRRRFARDLMSESALEFVEAKLAERDARHKRFGDSRYMLEPNVKEGKGALRDIHTLWWLARYVYPLNSFGDFTRQRLLTREEYQAFDQARGFLARVRIHLHLLAGRSEERLTFDRQHALAVAMGFGGSSNIRAITRFMRRYFVAVRTVGAVTRILCALLEEEKKRKPRRALAWRQPTLGPFLIDGERLGVKSPQALARRPVLMLELFKVAQEHGLDIHPRALRLIARNLKRIDRRLQQDTEANAVFLDILLSQKGPEATLRRMSDAGVLGRFIPEFGRIIGQTQFNLYHVYTVDEHTLVALGNLYAIEQGLLRPELPLASDIVHRIRLRRTLYLALLCHDIAKGQGGDHSQLGETIVARLAARFRLSADETATARWLVRRHLLFSTTAFKRDLSDPKTIADFVAEVRTPERLRLLLLLTVADMRAVSPSVWNSWKGAMMRDLFARAEAMMGTGATPEFSIGLSTEQHAAVERMRDQGRAIEVSHDRTRGLTQVTVCATDRRGLFSLLAGALSLSGANITGARIFTLKDGMAVDIFEVQDAAGNVFDHPRRLTKMAKTIEAALTGSLDLEQEFALRRTRSASARRAAMPVAGQVFVDNEASRLHTVIEISGQDRPGFLYEVTRTMTGLGLSIVTAHISTYGTEASDVFYVKDGFGMKVIHEEKVGEIREALLKAVSNPAPA